MGPRPVDRGVEGGIGARHGVEGQGADHVGGVEQPAAVGDGERPHRGRSLGAVDQREPFFCAEVKRFHPGLRQGVGAGHPFPVDDRLSLPHQYQRQVGERCEVARSSHRALARYDGVDAGLEEIEDPLHDQRAAPGVAGGEDIGAQQEHGANHILGKRLADSTRVGEQQIELELLQLIGRDPHLGELAESGIDPVDHLSRGEDILDHLPGVSHPGPSVGDRA